MGCGYQPSLIATDEEKDGHCISSQPSGGWTPAAYSLEADVMSVPFDSLGYDNFSGHDIRGDFNSYPPDLNCSPDSRNDGNLINAISEMSKFCRESEMSYANASMRELSYGIEGNDSAPANRLMNANLTSTGYCNSDNFMPPRCENITGYPIKAHGAEAKNSRSRFQISSSSECSTSLLPLVDNFGAIGNKSDISFIPPSFSSSQKVDRNFLTLGIGSGTEVRPNSNFSTLEIASKLDEVSSHCNYSTVKHCSVNPLNLTPSMSRAGRMLTSAGGPNSNFSAQKIASKSEDSSVRDCAVNSSGLIQSMGSGGRIRTSAGGLSSSACSSASRMPTHDEGGLDGDTGFRLDTIPSSGQQTAQAYAQSYFSQNCHTSVFDSTSLSLPFRSPLISHSKCGTQPGLTSTCFASQPIFRQQENRESSITVSSESSRSWLSPRPNESIISHIQLGSLIPLPGGESLSSADVHVPKSVRPARSLIPLAGGESLSNADFHFPESVRPERIQSSTAEDTRTATAKKCSSASDVLSVGCLNSHNAGPEALGNNLYPDRKVFQISNTGSIQSATAGSFPKRLGLQPNDLTTARTIRGPSSAAQLYPIKHPASAGQSIIPGAKSEVLPQSSPIVSHPYLKRKYSENSASGRLSQQRKIVPQPPIYLSTPTQTQSIQATPAPLPAAVHIPPTPLHIKWRGFDDQPPEPTGEKCLLCKRDLSFTAEGLVFQPAAPPSVAVLPCGHTFHEHCLQIITPQDQLSTPPCIPCAIGET